MNEYKSLSSKKVRQAPVITDLEAAKSLSQASLHRIDEQEGYESKLSRKALSREVSRNNSNRQSQSKIHQTRNGDNAIPHAYTFEQGNKNLASIEKGSMGS